MASNNYKQINCSSAYTRVEVPYYTSLPIAILGVQEQKECRYKISKMF